MAVYFGILTNVRKIATGHRINVCNIHYIPYEQCIFSDFFFPVVPNEE